ncbi:PAAR domain-containing protein [Stenotrophomonas riyadhensis]|uniref:PAAR domain-containing protein n=1 Tax=Stenotrophomonas riyadhensis TaxID=2859893 RepID=UPI003306734D
MLIALGDKHTGGGTVITGSPDTDIDGIQVARIGDKAVCPLHKGVFPRVTGDGTLIIDGQAVPFQVGKSAAEYLEH